MMRRPLSSLRWTTLALIAFSFSVSGAVHADSGVSDERVSLPDGPGSIGGVGENADVDPNMGMMRYNVPIETPGGFPNATPTIKLSYASGSGATEVGVGWNLSARSAIERMTLRGLPEYTTDDEFQGPSGELVYVGDLEGTRVYRARFESGFARYRWYGWDTPGSDYWVVEMPNGNVQYYGADESGTTVGNARVQSGTDTFRYMLVAEFDVNDHAVRYTYTKSGGWPLLDTIGWVYGGGMTPRFSVRFGYEAREDYISTAEPGFVIELQERLSEVAVFSSSERIRRYLLEYETQEASGGASRLANVTQRGRGDATTPIAFSFGYSRSLDGSCEGECDGPYMVEMGTLPGGVSLSNGRATLLDINGDALPDVLSTSLSGEHTWIMSELDPDTGDPSFGEVRASTATVGGSSFILSATGVQVLDLNGDGFTDIASSRSGGLVLCNDGSGDWNGSGCIMDSTLPQFTEDEAGDANPQGVRFMDYDDDKRIDVVRTLAGSTEVFVNDGLSFSQTSVQDIGAQFDVSMTLQLTDLNGDGLQDPVEIQSRGALRYRTNLGFGRWTEWDSIFFDGFDDADVPLMQLEDLNGDGLADIVVVSGNQVKVATNMGGGRFSDARVLLSEDVEGSIPSRIGETVVLFADMNGNGSRDIVWFQADGVRFLELYPTKPNLISRIENGIGSVQDIEYGSSVLQQARDTEEWEHQLPYAMNIVTRFDSWNRLTGGEDGEGLHEVRVYRYRSGYYDGVDKTFRGFSYVERETLAEMAADRQEGDLSTMVYEVGDIDPYRNGLKLEEASFAGDGTTWEPLRRMSMVYESCPVAEIPDEGSLRLPIRHICMTSKTEVQQERRPEAEWATTLEEMEYDGYGQTVLTRRHGVVHMGSPENPSGCGTPDFGPRGDDCLGDERFLERTMISPGADTNGRWIIGNPSSMVEYGEEGGPQRETRYRYDGEDFVGLPAGQLDRGLQTSVEQILGGGESIFPSRQRYDADGNVVERLTPRGAPSITDDFRRSYTMSADGLNTLRIEASVRDAEGNPHLLRRDYSYETSFNQVSEVTSWMVIVDGSAITPRNPRRFRYDDFGRPSALLQPGDAEGTPTETYTYELASPVSRVSTQERSVQNGPLDIESVRCIDGLGRVVQERTRVGEGNWQVDGFKEFNRRGQAVRVFQPYTSPTGDCDMSAPADERFTLYEYDARDRRITTTAPDADLYGGTASTARVEFRPLESRTYDYNDSDSESPHFDTPQVERFDGLGRLISVTREIDGEFAVYGVEYDGLGRPVRVVDPGGNALVQEYDLVDRITRVVDPNAGTTTYEYDADSNITRRVDGRGVVVVATYDGFNRPLSQGVEGQDAHIELSYDVPSESCDECTNTANRLVSTRYDLGDLGEGLDEAGYDARGNVIFEGRTIEGFRYEREYVYDNVERLVRSTFPGGTVLEREYDAAGRQVAIPGFVENFGFDEQGQLGSIEYSNGASTRYSYDIQLRMTLMEHLDAAGQVVRGYDFRQDRQSNLIAVDDVSEVATERPTVDHVFGYDSGYRVTTAAYGAADGLETITTEYDLLDNILSRVSSLGETSRAHVGEYTYGGTGPNAVTSAGSMMYDYDAGGFITARGTRDYTWDHLGRLATASQNGNQRTRIHYASGGRRVAEERDGGLILHPFNEFEVRDGIINIYPRYGSRRLARLRSDTLQVELLGDAVVDGEINAADAWASHAADEGILEGVGENKGSSRLLRAAARRLLLDDGEDLVYLQQDHQNSNILATDDAGVVIGESLYYATGGTRWDDGFVDSYGFSGMEADEATGLTSFLYRQLDTFSGRWGSVDPQFMRLRSSDLRKTGEATVGYAYTGNNFASNLDPDGRFSFRGAAAAIGRGLSRLGGGLRTLGRLGAAAGRLAGRGLLAGARGFGRLVKGTGRLIGRGFRAAWRGAKRAWANPNVRKKIGFVVLSAVLGGLVGGPLGALALAGMVAGASLVGAGVQKFLKSFKWTRAIAKTVQSSFSSPFWKGKVGTALRWTGFLLVAAVGIATGIAFAATTFGAGVPVLAGWGVALGKAIGVTTFLATPVMDFTAATVVNGLAFAYGNANTAGQDIKAAEAAAGAGGGG